MKRLLYLIVKVVRGEKEKVFMEEMEEDDIEVCYGFDIQDIPRPIIIKVNISYAKYY